MNIQVSPYTYEKRGGRVVASDSKLKISFNAELNITAFMGDLRRKTSRRIQAGLVVFLCRELFSLTVIGWEMRYNDMPSDLATKMA
jgi:hypothetical protein